MRHPLLYEVHTRQWLAALSRAHRRTIDLHDVPDDEIDLLARRGVTHLWLMGVWPCGQRSRRKALEHEGLLDAYRRALPDFAEEDVKGSPYAVCSAHVAGDLGGDEGLAKLRRRLRERGIAVVLDFVPNHVGLDHPWVVEQPHLLVHAAESFPESFRIDGGPFIAHGKDPYFPAWTDVAQIDYRSAVARRAMIDVVASIADRCDGVRCDMAMLMLPEVFERTWAHVPPVDPSPDRSTSWDFWGQAIARVRERHPSFLFLAEAYWELEQRLLDLGFDYAYDKTLYDKLVHRRIEEVQPLLSSRSPEFLERTARFLENHDEDRVARHLGLDEHRAALHVVLGLPGMRFLHDGQLEGARARSPIQLRRRRDEAPDEDVRAMTERLLAAAASSSVGRGRGRLLQPAAAWEENPTAKFFVVVLWQEEPGRFDLTVVNLAPHRAQCRVPIPAEGIEGARLVLEDLLSDERWERSGDEMRGPGLYLDVAGHATQLFRATRR